MDIQEGVILLEFGEHVRNLLLESPEKGQSITINHGCTPGP